MYCIVFNCITICKIKIKKKFYESIKKIPYLNFISNRGSDMITNHLTINPNTLILTNSILLVCILLHGYKPSSTISNIMKLRLQSNL